jgi:prepilin-type N-terminal cleavage/methylation domain-containing protein/prepilin-type processing-associated H-X9-DG protein
MYKTATFPDASRACYPGRRRTVAKGFSIVELLVVMAIISVLFAMLFPALAKARQAALSLQCQTNLRNVGLLLELYQNQNGGWLYPLVSQPTTGVPQGRGMWLPPNERWPMFVFDMSGAPDPPPFNPNAYHRQYDPVKFPVEPYTPPTLRCPTDFDPVEAHTYVLNGIISQHWLKVTGVSSSSEIILAGEKYSVARDYFFEVHKSFNLVLDPYRHGTSLLSNYLFVDGHVSPQTREQAQEEFNPWKYDKGPSAAGG